MTDEGSTVEKVSAILSHPLSYNLESADRKLIPIKRHALL